MLHPLVSTLILKNLSESLKLKGLICALFNLYCVVLPSMINLACRSEGKELPLFQHFRSTKTS